jgi:hypothetical protein
MIRKKYILNILLGLFLTFKSFAECSSSGINVFPRTKTIYSNPIFIIEGYFSSQSVIRNLNKTNSIYLTSGKDTIRLFVTKRLESHFRLTQSILKPSSNLILGKYYKLNIDNLNEYEKADFERDSIGWTVSDIIDRQKPIWTKLPSYNSKEMISYGCGPALYVNFCACILDKSPVVVYTRLKNLKNKSISDYYIKPDSCSFQIGHGMCSGEFDFEQGQEYEATFSLMDASGNISNETQPIKFISPTEKDENHIDEKEVKCNCPKQKTMGDKIIIWKIILLIGVGLFLFLALKKRTK